MNPWVNYNGKKLIKPEKVKGYNQLDRDNKKLFEKFSEKYYSAYEFPENHQPKSVKVEDGYLRVNFKTYWLHVIDSNTWY